MKELYENDFVTKKRPKGRYDRKTFAGLPQMACEQTIPSEPRVPSFLTTKDAKGHVF